MSEEEDRQRLRYLQLKKKKALAVADAEKPVDTGAMPNTEGEGFNMQDVRGGIGAVNKGMFAGFGDEIVGGIRALDDQLFPSTYDFGDDVSKEGQSLEEGYKMYRDDVRSSDAEFARENPGSALGLTLAGGVLSPLNKVAPGVGTGRAGMAGRGAVEGALAGYGESEADTLGGTLRDAALGGGLGGTVGGALGVGGHLLGKTKGIENLWQEGADGVKRFKPLHLAADADSLAGRLYRNTFGRSSGGTKLRQQEQPWLDDAAEAVEAERLGLTARKLDLDDAARREGVDAAAVTRGERTTLAESTRQERVNMDTHIDALEAAELNPKQAVPKLPKATAATKIDTRNAEPTVKFRRDAAVESIPVRERELIFRDPEGGTIDIDDTEMVDDMIYDFWQSDDAFGMVKGRDFDLDNQELRGYVRDVMETPESRSQLGEVVTAAKKRAKAEGFDLKIEDVTEDGDTFFRKMTDDEVLDWAFDGEIAGDVLMELRNIYARGANKASGMSRGSQRKVASAFDKYIARNIDDPDEYFEHIAAYPNSITHGKAVAGNKANAAGGKFTIDEHQAAGKPMARRGTDKPGQRSKKRPMQPQARAAREELAAMAPPPAALPDATAANAARQANVVADAANAATKGETKRLRRTMRAGLADRTGRRSQDIADRAADIGEEITGRTKRGKAALSEEAVTGPLGQASARARKLAEKATPTGASGLSERLTDVMIGSIALPQGAPMAAKLGAGVGGALGGTTKPVQSFIAGQAAPQRGAQALAKALRGLTKEEQIIEMMNRGLSRQAAISAIGE